MSMTAAAASGKIRPNDLNEILPIQPMPLPESCPPLKVWPLKGERKQRRLVGRTPWFLLSEDPDGRLQTQSADGAHLGRFTNFFGFNGYASRL